MGQWRVWPWIWAESLYILVMMAELIPTHELDFTDVVEGLTCMFSTAFLSEK